MNVRGLAQGTRYEMAELKIFLEKRYKVRVIGEVLEVEGDEELCFVFPYGVAVLWNTGYDWEKRVLEDLSEFCEELYETPFPDDFEYRDGAERFRIHLDMIELETADPMTMLALSHGIAQSLKLSAFETAVAATIEESRHLPKSLAKTGQTPLGRRELAKERGKLFLAKSDIHLHYELLDTPEFFWEYPELEPFYVTMSNYLEVRQRVEVLGKKLEIIQELLNMLADEQNHKHSSLLEWIIIVLIAVEIVFFFVHDLFKLI